MAVSYRIVWDRAAVRALRTDPDVQAEVTRIAEDLGRALAASTPRDSGAGAASIDVTTTRSVGARDVGWDAAHYYLIFPEYGTEHQDEQRFARDVLDRYAHL